jgi:ubiquinone/menaquinone biosynthesis C-methylase UbiE
VDVVADFQHLPFKTGSVTVVYSRRCLQHLPNQQLAIFEVNRVLVKGGKFLLIVASWIGVLYFYLVFNIKYFGRYHIMRLYTKRRLVKLFSAMKVEGIWLMKVLDARGKDWVVYASKR